MVVTVPSAAVAALVAGTLMVVATVVVVMWVTAGVQRRVMRWLVRREAARVVEDGWAELFVDADELDAIAGDRDRLVDAVSVALEWRLAGSDA